MAERTPRELHELDQMTGAVLALAMQASAFFKALIEEGVPEEPATYLTGNLMDVMMTPSDKEDEDEDG